MPGRQGGGGNEGGWRSIKLADIMEIKPIYDGVFLSLGANVALLRASEDIVTRFVAKALGVLPNWTTTRCEAAVEQLCGEAMVAASSKPYNEAWLFSISLSCEVGTGSSFELTEKPKKVSGGLQTL